MEDVQTVSRVYANFRGVDFRGEEVSLTRSPDSVNMWKDYRETDRIRTRPGLAQLAKLEDPIYGVFFYKGEMFVHSGRNIFHIHKNGSVYLTEDQANPAPSNTFVFEDKLYFKDGKNYLLFEEQEGRFREVVGYIPTTSIGRKPAGGGTQYEDVNLLSDYRINTFLADGEDWLYYLDTQSIDEVVSVVVDGVELSEENDDYRVDLAAGTIHFANYPLPPLTAGQDNVVITFKKAVPGYKERILECTQLQMFDNRVFFTGNDLFPNTVWHCSLEDPTYCSDLDYYREGVDDARITGMVAGNNALWVFREPSSANTTVFYHTPTVDDGYGKIYPARHSSVSVGCVGKAINFNDDIVFFSDRGMEGISGDVTTEQVIAHRSTMVDRKLTAEKAYRDMLLQEWKGYLFVFIGNKVYLADSRAVFTNENHIEYDWFYWELEHPVTAVCAYGEMLYIGTEDGRVCSFSDPEQDVESYWVTPKDKFKYPYHQKTTNKRGCVVEATGDLVVYAKTENSDFEHVATGDYVTDYFVPRLKRKKFKDLQLKFYSLTRFSLEMATLEVFVGGYIKR